MPVALEKKPIIHTFDTSPRQKTTKFLNHPYVHKTSKISKYGIAAPVSILSAISGITSAITANSSSGSNDLLDKAASLLGKWALFGNAIPGFLTNAQTNNFLGAVGYATDFLTSTLSSSENMYTFRGIATGLDSIPLGLEAFSRNKEKTISENLKIDPQKFTHYDNIEDNLQKTWFAAKEILKDVKNDFKKNNFFQALTSVFKRGEFNIFASCVGLCSGTMLAFIPGLRNVGAKIRDIFGFHSDLAVIQCGGYKSSNTDGLTEEAKAKKQKGDLSYKVSGITYTLGTVLDFIYRFTKTPNLHLSAIGVDRLGAFLMVLGNYFHNEKDKDDKDMES